MLLTVKELSERLQIKRSTLYAWAAQGKIPCCRIHGLIRFDPDAIDRWLRSMTEEEPGTPTPGARRKAPLPELDAVIARARQAPYNPAHGETRPKSSSIGKEDADGAV